MLPAMAAACDLVGLADVDTWARMGLAASWVGVIW